MKAGAPYWDAGLFFGQLQEAGMKFLATLARNTRGATAIEYGLIAALIAVAAITAMSGLGTNIKNTFNNVANNMNYS
jgi:pilus assembly protein Flp/PilA